MKKRKQRNPRVLSAGALVGRKATPDELVQVFRPFALFPRHVLEYLSANSQILLRSSGSLIFREQAESNFVFFVASGRVVLNKIAVKGRQFIVDIVTPGLPFGLVDSLQDVPYSFSARAHSRSQILCLSREPLASLLTQYPMVYREVMHIVANRWREGLAFSVALAHDRVDRRVALVLLRLVEKLSPEKSTSVRLKIELTRLELSELAGCAPETASRVAKRLERAGCISLTKQGVIFVNNLDQLIKLTQR